jgi:glycosyltransferase involved in cell wall biosynthesis
MKIAADTPATLPREPIGLQARVSIIVPVRNEERYIEQFLEGLCAQDFPPDRMEVILADGQSSDRTVELAERFRDRLAHLRVCENPARAKAPALNMCIPLTTGEVILIMDCHTRYPSNYVSGLVNHLRETDADYVGGRVETEPGANTLVAQAIALALSHPFGVGAGTYRTSHETGGGLAPFGCYRRQLPFVIGGYNERLPRTHDDEFIARIIRHGGGCLVCGDICSTYFTRPTLRSLCAQMFGNGSNHVATFVELPGHFLARHYVPFAFVTALGIGALQWMWNHTHWLLLAVTTIPYLVIDLVSSYRVARRTRWSLFPIMLGLFPLIHISYGLGTWWGVFVYALLRWHRRGERKTGEGLIAQA